MFQSRHFGGTWSPTVVMEEATLFPTVGPLIGFATDHQFLRSTNNMHVLSHAAFGCPCSSLVGGEPQDSYSSKVEASYSVPR